MHYKINPKEFMRRLGAASIGIVVFTFGCERPVAIDRVNWSRSEEVAKSSDSLSTSFSLYQWNGSLLAFGGDSGTFAARTLDEDGISWKTVSTVNPEWVRMNVDQRENRFVVSRAIIWSNSLDAEFIIGSLAPDGRFVSKTGTHLRLQQSKLFLNAKPNLRLTNDERPRQDMFAGGTMKDGEIRIPYRIVATPIEGKVIMAGQAVSANGVFASSDGGQTWRSETISTRYSLPPKSCRTKAFYYYFALAGTGGWPLELWYSRCPVESASWSAPDTLNKTGAANPKDANLHAIAEEDTVHLCWLDGRSEKTKFSLTHPRAGNYEVAYANRSDSDAAWSKDVILSKGLRFAFAPSISVEGKNVVVAWAGAKNDREGRTEYGASDIYYVTSRDAGKTWTKPIQITDGFKDGITSGRPQIALRNGVIHLFYIQGKLSYKEVSAGMVKLNQPPWPIYYTQRPFTEIK